MHTGTFIHKRVRRPTARAAPGVPATTRRREMPLRREETPDMKPPGIFTALILALLLLPAAVPAQAETAQDQGTMLLAQAPPPGQWPPSPDEQFPRGQQRQPGQRRPPGQQPPPPGFAPPPPPPPGARRPPGPGPGPGPWGPGGGGWRAQALARCAQEQAYCAQMCNTSYYGNYRDQCNVNCNAVYVACVNRANTLR